jgi:hypothetical protein
MINMHSYFKHKFNPFPEAIEQNGIALQEVTQRETKIRSKAATSGVNAGPRLHCTIRNVG